jgi:hypothetical protein
MIDSSTLLREFVESLKGKGYPEVIFLADREATQAYRNALRSCHRPHHRNSDWCQYAKTLTNMISFLRNEVKVERTDVPTYNLFHSIQNGIDRQHQEMIQSHRAEHHLQKAESNG